MTTTMYRQVGAWLGAFIMVATGARAWAADFHVGSAQDLRGCHFCFS
jgi:hypothetical protein